MAKREHSDRRVEGVAKGDERRQEIIEAARELYEQQGLSHTSIMDVTARIGVTRTLFYHYFSDKDALTSAVLDAYIDDFVEALTHWNEGRREGDIDHALCTIVKLLRIGLFEKDSFRVALASRENAALYLEFVNRVADHAARYIIDTTVRDYAALHEVRIEHLYETFYVLILGVIGYLRQHPDADDAVIADVIAQTLHIEGYEKREV
ncbi:TetR/AcrR family transcriptional regulator [Adlercreutzia murintestinalis]|uniref:TetR/AcrR family transcriptional regulator n=1 Tax=Adlercreutzia murintestinalis TaxID=2941325 RepID=UPI00203D75DC|nr:TetR/AcrR family transcriptional regulator [Adlercreutzia murintestinalis]